jgi:hypothetical protein
LKGWLYLNGVTMLPDRKNGGIEQHICTKMQSGGAGMLRHLAFPMGYLVQQLRLLVPAAGPTAAAA